MANFLYPSVDALIADLEADASKHHQASLARDPKLPKRDQEVIAANRRAYASAYRSIASQLRATMIGETVEAAVPLALLPVVFGSTQ